MGYENRKGRFPSSNEQENYQHQVALAVMRGHLSLDQIMEAVEQGDVPLSTGNVRGQGQSRNRSPQSLLHEYPGGDEFHEDDEEDINDTSISNTRKTHADDDEPEEFLLGNNGNGSPQSGRTEECEDIQVHETASRGIQNLSFHRRVWGSTLTTPKTKRRETTVDKMRN